MTCASEYVKSIMARVTTKAGSLRTDTKKPLTAPIASGTATATTRAAGSPSDCSTINSTVLRPTMEPTLRSMPAVRMTRY